MFSTKRYTTFFQADDNRGGNNTNGSQGQNGKKKSKNKSTEKRGFAQMVGTPEGERKQREIASQGGRAAHETGRAHEWTSKEAAEAGRKGGRAKNKNKGNRSGANNRNSGTNE